MLAKMSAESLDSITDDEENRLDHLSLQASLSRIDFRPKNNIIPPEDIAAVAFSRLFNEETESAPGRMYPKTPVVRSSAGHQSAASTGHGIQKCRHKSPANRPHSLRPPLSIDGISSWVPSDSVRKTKSTALPKMIHTFWPRSASASTPELKGNGQGFVTQPLPPNGVREDCRRVYLVRTACYYNLRLIYVILNCFILVIGFVYLGAAVALLMHTELILVIVDYRLHVYSIICLFGVALILLVISIIGLCFVQSGRKKTVAHGGSALVMVAVLVALAVLQSAAQLRVEVDAEFQMLSTIQPGLPAKNVWDYLHRAFKCCGVRGYLDWCQKVDANAKVYTSPQDFLGSFACNLPESCCLNHRVEFGIFKNIGYPCVVAPTPWNTHRSGCLAPILAVVSYFGKMYRIANFATAFILLLTATTSMLLFTYL